VESFFKPFWEMITTIFLQTYQKLKPPSSSNFSISSGIDEDIVTCVDQSQTTNLELLY
jgi:hypothetical protein